MIDTMKKVKKPGGGDRFVRGDKEMEVAEDCSDRRELQQPPNLRRSWHSLTSASTN